MGIHPYIQEKQYDYRYGDSKAVYWIDYKKITLKPVILHLIVNNPEIDQIQHN